MAEGHRNERVFDRVEAMREQDKKLRKELSGHFESDEKFHKKCGEARAFAEQMKKYLEEAGDAHEEAVDRSRSFAAACSLAEKLVQVVKELSGTERGIASLALKETDEMRQEAEDDASGSLTKTQV